MKKEIMQIWVAALRSGEYKQVKGRLAKAGAHCCLGVLCELMPGINKWTPGAGSAIQFDGGASSLPPRVISWAGVRSWSPMLEGSPSLADMNDDGKTFAEIADYIEANYEQL